jgi:protein tyrosine phosphatase (PTP) superfamily phosphohydrolase (DUF442 family)
VRANGRLSRSFAPAILLSLSVAIPAAAQTARPDKVASIRIENFGQVNANYYRGAQPKGRDYADLAGLGVKSVIDLTGDDGEADEKGMVERAGMRYSHIPMTTHEPPTSARLAEFLKIVNDPASRPVYVHCVGGRHRTGVMTAVYRITADAWTADRAFAEMKQYKFGADFLHPEFKRFVYAYHPEAGQTAASPPIVATKIGTD